MGLDAQHGALVAAAAHAARAAVLAVALAAPQAAADCRQALVLGLDVSASVDAQEFTLQTQGLAAAFLDDEVRAAFLAVPDAPVALAIFEWSGADWQEVVVPWTVVDGPGVLDRLADRLLLRGLPEAQSTTAIGAAMLYAAGLFEEGPDCGLRTLDLSGDGQNNDLPRPEEARFDPRLAGVTINGLVIGAGLPPGHALDPNRGGVLTRYYAQRVIKGPGAFVEEADSHADFGRAIRRKLIREISTRIISDLDPAR